MSDVYKLHNKIKHYEWGSAELLPCFLGIENSNGRPYAEMWMGTHNSAPSQIELGDKLVDLKEISGELPFLFKLLTLERPLSIQAHPNKEQAEKGFVREEKSGLTIKAPTRNYKDSNHKPEILCAITPITLMAGFRETEKIYRSFEAFLSIASPLKEIFGPLLSTLESGSLSDFFHTLFNFSRIEQEYLCTFINKKEGCEADEVITKEQWKLMKNFAGLYPWDPGIISPLFLNVITLQPGQAIFIPDGVLHAYISGFGLELMANSDNILRCGLTHKHVNIDELMKILHFVPFVPQIITPGAAVSWFSYHTPCSNFLLSHMHADSEMLFPGNSPAICVVIEGELKTCAKTFKKGESFFIPKGAQTILFDGNYSLFAACSNVKPQFTRRLEFTVSDDGVT
jgi:mannose-6-phosphate isomerase